MNQNNIAVLIPAAGIGSRFDSIIPKQYASLGGSTVLEQTVNSFASHPSVSQIILAISESDSLFKDMRFENHYKVSVAQGGLTRHHSVCNCLGNVSKTIEYVIVHDAVRPFFSIDLIMNQIQFLDNFDGAVPVISIIDSMRHGDDMKAVDREKYYAVQTPQIFTKASLSDAFSKSKIDELNFTDESQLLEYFGYKIKFFQGEVSNKKITYQSDLYLSPILDHRYGRGIDYHLYEEGNGFYLGGVKLKSHVSIVSHSDGDVLLHSLADAVLGSAGLKDIGFYFPDSDPINKGLDSKLILKKALELLHAQNLKLNHIDITVVCGIPKISPYVDEITNSLSNLCNLSPENIAIKSTTTEGLGGIGHDKGIAVFSVVSISS